MKIFYIFDCMNADIEHKCFTFDSDKEAINFAINYEAVCIKYIEYAPNDFKGEIIYDPYDCFN